VKYKVSVEKGDEHKAVENVIDNAFRVKDYVEPSEVGLVRKLRRTNAFIPSLSLVAKNDSDEIVGQVLLTKATIEGKKKVETLVLAPISVRRSNQNQGIGAMLMNESIERAEAEGFKSIIVLGHEHYYPKFGFDYASNWSIYPSFEGVPPQNYFALELEDGGLHEVSGIVYYAQPFYEENSI